MATIVNIYVGPNAAANFPGEITRPDLKTAITDFAVGVPSLVALGERRRFLLEKHEFVSSTSFGTISSTCDSDCYYEITTVDDNASFLDPASRATRALRYDGAKGAALKYTNTGSTTGLNVTSAYFRMSKIQFSGADTASACSLLSVSGSTPNGIHADINDCIFEANTTSGGGVMSVSGGGAGSTVRNCTVIQKSTNAAAKICSIGNGSRSYNNTLVSLGTTLTAGVSLAYNASTFRNTYIGGVIATHSWASGAGSNAPIVTKCASNIAPQNANWIYAPLDSTTFKNTTPGAHDLRPASNSLLINAGASDVVDVTNSSSDIYGYPRVGGYDIGAAESQPEAVAPTFNGPNIGNISATQGVAIAHINAAALFSDPGDTMTFSLVGSWPTGITINSATGIIAGTPNAATGTYNGLSVRATDGSGLSADSSTLSFAVANAAPRYTGRIANVSVVVGTAINANAALEFTDGDVLTFTASPAGSAWPAGLSISSAGVISGTLGSESVTTGLMVRATDPAGLFVDSEAFSVTISATATPVQFSGQVPAQPATVGVPFSLALANHFSGSQAPFAYSVASGTLPPGLTLNASTGVISGTPTTSNTWSVVIRATDAGANAADSGLIAFTVAAAPVAVTFSGPIPPQYGTPGSAFYLPVAAYFQGNRTPISYSISGNSGLGISSSGAVSGTLPAAGSYSFAVTATDADGVTASSGNVALTVSAAGAGPVITTPELKKNDGTLLANSADWTVNVYHRSTGVLVKQVPGLATDAAGVLRISAAEVTAAEYAYEPVHATHGRRLPTGEATGATPTITTPPLMNNTGLTTGLLANTAGWTVNVYNKTTGALVKQVPGLATDAVGVLRISAAEIVAGEYAYEPVHTLYGRRLPTGSAA